MTTCFYYIGFENSTRIERFEQLNRDKAAFELISAIDGRNFPDSFVESIFTASFVRHQRKHKGTHWLKATLGCMLSHVRAIERAVESGADHLVVAEDDAVFTQKPHPYLEEMKQDGYDLVYLNDRMKSSNPNPPPPGQLIKPLRGEHIRGTGGEGYALSAKGMETVLHVFRSGLSLGLPTGFDGFLQSFAFEVKTGSEPAALLSSLGAILTEDGEAADLARVGAQAVDSPRWKQLRPWVLLRNSNLKVGLATPSFVTHSDGGESIINAVPSGPTTAASAA